MLAAGTAGFVGVAAFGGSVAHAFMEKISNDDGKQVLKWARKIDSDVLGNHVLEECFKDAVQDIFTSTGPDMLTGVGEGWFKEMNQVKKSAAGWGITQTAKGFATSVYFGSGMQEVTKNSVSIFVNGNGLNLCWAVDCHITTSNGVRTIHVTLLDSMLPEDYPYTQKSVLSTRNYIFKQVCSTYITKIEKAISDAKGPLFTLPTMSVPGIPVGMGKMPNIAIGIPVVPGVKIPGMPDVKMPGMPGSMAASPAAAPAAAPEAAPPAGEIFAGSPEAPTAATVPSENAPTVPSANAPGDDVLGEEEFTPIATANPPEALPEVEALPEDEANPIPETEVVSEIDVIAQAYAPSEEIVAPLAPKSVTIVDPPVEQPAPPNPKPAQAPAKPGAPTLSRNKKVIAGFNDRIAPKDPSYQPIGYDRKAYSQ